MWEISNSDIPGGSLHRVMEDGESLSFRQFFALLGSDGAFADWYSRSLAATAADAFYWELPPLTAATIDHDAEFVLIDAPMLARLPSDPQPFAAHFDRNPDADVVVFPNLGGDAILVVPTPRDAFGAYSHLAAFLRQADSDQVRALWRVTAETFLDELSDTPKWLNTAGGGVFWLHVRLDSRPKYYQHRLYAQSP